MHEPPCLELYAAGFHPRLWGLLGSRTARSSNSDRNSSIGRLVKDLPERMSDEFAPRRYSQAGACDVLSSVVQSLWHAVSISSACQSSYFIGLSVETSQPFAALHHHSGNWGETGPIADIVLSTRMTQTRNGAAAGDDAAT